MQYFSKRNLLLLAFNPLLGNLRYQWYVLALDSPRCCSSACGHGYFLMKDSSPALIRTEPRGHAKKKKSNKTCCNQNMPALPLSDDL